MFRVIHRGEKALCLSLPDGISTTIHTISISLQSVGIFFSTAFTHLILRKSTLLLLTWQTWPQYWQSFWSSNRWNQPFSIDISSLLCIFPLAAPPSWLDRCCFLCIGGLFQAPPLDTGPLSRHLQELSCSVSLLCSHSYSLSSLEGELGWIFVCFLVPGVPPPLISAPPPVYLSSLCCRRANGTTEARFSRHHQSVQYDNFQLAVYYS